MMSAPDESTATGAITDETRSRPKIPPDVRQGLVDSYIESLSRADMASPGAAHCRKRIAQLGYRIRELRLEVASLPPSAMVLPRFAVPDPQTGQIPLVYVDEHGSIRANWCVSCGEPLAVFHDDGEIALNIVATAAGAMHPRCAKR